MTRSELVLLTLLVFLAAITTFVFFGVELHHLASHVLDGVRTPQ